MNKIKVFVFDHGGTMRIGNNEIPRKFAELGYSIKSISDLGPHAQKAHENLNLGLINEVEFWTEVDKDLISPTGFSTFLFDSKVSFPIEGMKNIVTELKENGYRTVLGTNVGTPDMQKNILDGYYSFFDTYYASCELHIKKPNPAFFEAIAKAEGVSYSEMMLIDDKIQNTDIAKSLGMQAHLFKNSMILRKQLEDLGYLTPNK